MKKNSDSKDFYFLLGNELENFQNAFGHNEFAVSENGDEVEQDRIELMQLSRILNYLEKKHKLLHVYFNRELPRYLIESLQMLLRADNNYATKLVLNNKAFVKDFEKTHGPLRASNDLECIKLKLIKLNTILNEQYHVKLFFLSEKRGRNVERLHFFLKPLNTSYHSENEDYLIRDISFITDSQAFFNFTLNGFRYNSMENLCGITIQMRLEKYKPGLYNFELGGGIIAIFNSLYPQFPLIDFGFGQWHNVNVLFVEEIDNMLYLSDRMEYSDYLEFAFFTHAAYNNTAHICTPDEIKEFGLHLIVKWNKQQPTRLTAEEIVELLKAFKNELNEME